MNKYTEIKVYVPTPEISEAVQRVLIKAGCLWVDGEAEIRYLDCKYLFVDCKGRITWEENDTVFFKNHRYKEVPYQAISDPYRDVKIAWANGEAIQRKRRMTNYLGETILGDWEDYIDKNAIDLKSGGDWRIKPKTKTIKQWEYKKTTLGNSGVCTVVFKNRALAMESYRDCSAAITEPVLVEYEVPNE